MAARKKSSEKANLLTNMLETTIFTRIGSLKEKADKRVVDLIFYGGDAKEAYELEQLSAAPKWQLDNLKDKPKPIQLLAGEHGPICLVVAEAVDSVESKSEDSVLTESEYGLARDVAGQLLRSHFSQHHNVNLSYVKAGDSQKIGFLVGLSIGYYKYKQSIKGKSYLPRLQIHGMDDKQIETARLIGESTLVARHLVNLPASELNPKTYAETLEDLFSESESTTVTIWDHSKLEKEGMGMHIAVGQGAKHKSRLVHVSYQPKSKVKAPLAFIGKGITFDSGGLDIKPPVPMRLMKKDMGGSATVAGLAYYVVNAKLSKPCDFYFALAENSIDADSFRPGDVLTARNGKTVEIDNTDAEGRLVLGDALCVAASQKNKPKTLIDVATLTGSIKVGLGADIPGLFTNSNDIADALTKAAQAAGEPIWRMPLANRYKKMLRSNVADMTNSSASSFAGAITAALFLQEFTDGLPWAHLDIYAWTDAAQGAYAEPGATGQMVQMLIEAMPHL